MSTTWREQRGRCAAIVVLLSCLLPAGPAAWAHESAPPRDCTAPVRPADDHNDVLWQRFLDDVDAFRACISAYAQANNRAAAIHRQAANDATQEWNRFVHSELNVPEDYPWPPPQHDAAR